MTTRSITHFVPRQQAPFGLPEQIIEAYWDMFQKREVQLKRIVCEYTPEGRLARQEHFDAEDNHCYYLFWEYDPHGNVTKEINALWQETRKYDDENNHANNY